MCAAPSQNSVFRGYICLSRTLRKAWANQLLHRQVINGDNHLILGKNILHAVWSLYICQTTEQSYCLIGSRLWTTLSWVAIHLPSCYGKDSQSKQRRHARGQLPHACLANNGRRHHSSHAPELEMLLQTLAPPVWGSVQSLPSSVPELLSCDHQL